MTSAVRQKFSISSNADEGERGGEGEGENVTGGLFLPHCTRKEKGAIQADLVQEVIL